MSFVVIAGPTGSGKSELALRLAMALGGEIVNYDSVQMYRGFDIGSAKPSIATRALLPHHLFDIADATDEFNAADYARIAQPTCDAIKTPILVGGTFFYLRALLSGLPEMPGRDETIRKRLRNIGSRPRGQDKLHTWLRRIDPISGARVAVADRHRVERALEVWISSGRPISEFGAQGAGRGAQVILALTMDRARLVSILDARVEKMYGDGLVDETRALLDRYPHTARPFGTIGYKEAAAVVAGEVTLDAAIAETGRRTRAYAKRQMTWLRSERNVQWIDATNGDEAFAAAMRLLEGKS